MATPARTVQFRDPKALMICFEQHEIPAFAIKQGPKGPPLFKYEGEELSEACQLLSGFLDQLVRSESAAIYSLCLYDNMDSVKDGKITERTDAGLCWNFRFREFDGAALPGMAGMPMSGMGQLLEEMKKMREELEELKAGKSEDDGGLMGTIGQVLENPALQPIVAGLVDRLMDWLTPKKMGELRRVSGVPAPVETIDWLENVQLTTAITRLMKKEPTFPALMDKLADLAENKPQKFSMYVKMFKTLR